MLMTALAADETLLVNMEPSTFLSDQDINGFASLLRKSSIVFTNLVSFVEHDKIQCH